MHRDLLPKVFGDFGRDGALVSPLFVVASPDRKELTRLEHEHPPVELTLALKTAAKKLGAGMGRAAYRQVTSGLAQLRRLIDLNEFAAATVLLESLKKVPGNFAPNAEVKVAEQHLDEAGRGQIKRARELWAAQRLLDGLIAIDDVKASFGKLACAGTAASLLAEWEKSPAAATSLQDLKVHRGARQLYFQAVEQEQAGDRKKAIQTLDKLLRQFPESRFTDRGRAMRDGLVGG